MTKRTSTSPATLGPAILLSIGLAAWLDAACGGAPEDTPLLQELAPERLGGVTKISLKTAFDFTIEEDRADFIEQDLRFRDAIGPYAIYEVTGPEPRLIGPRVRLPPPGSHAMLCTANAYFREGTRTRTHLRLERGYDGEAPLISVEIGSQPPGTCTTAKDDYAERIAPPVPVSTNDPVDEAERIIVSMSSATPEGSTVVLRRASLSEPRGHNDSHSMPRICCEAEGECKLRTR